MAGPLPRPGRDVRRPRGVRGGGPGRAPGAFVLDVATRPRLAGVARAVVGSARRAQAVRGRAPLEDAYLEMVAGARHERPGGRRIRKESREYRRNNLIVLTMAGMPLVFLGILMAATFALPDDVSDPRAARARSARPCCSSS